MGCIKKLSKVALLFVVITFISGCGGGGGGGASTPIVNNSKTGIFIDDVVQGIKYKTDTSSGYTNSKGEFPFYDKKTEFFIGKIKIGEISNLPTDNKVFIQDLVGVSRNNIDDTRVLKIATFLQSLDTNENTNEIEITPEMFNKFEDLNEVVLIDEDIEQLLKDKSIKKKDIFDVKVHLGGSFSRNSKVLFDENEKNFLMNEFRLNYFWADEVNLNKPYTTFTDPNIMIKSFKHNLDDWSYAETFEKYENDAKQITKGFGCNFLGSNQIAFIDINSPCEKAGLKRGDYLTMINGKNINNDIFQKSRNNIGVESIFTIVRDDKKLNLKITPTAYNYKVSKSKIYNSSSNKKIGYFLFNEFASNSNEEINEAFTSFKSNDIEELVVDLRFNGGGSLNIASILLDKIAGLNNEDKVQFYLKYKNKDNENYTFMKDENSLNLKRVFFLTSKYSASASEAVINALKPYLDVKVIGSTTHGKPVGMSGKYISASYIYWLINFGIYNSNDEGEYFQGINVDCNVNDNYKELGDFTSEKLLQNALHYIEKDTCYNYSDFDNDGIEDYYDNDDDNDGVKDYEDFYKLDANCHKEKDGNGKKCYKDIIEKNTSNVKDIYKTNNGSYIFVKKNLFEEDENLAINFDVANSSTKNAVKLRHSFDKNIVSKSFIESENLLFISYSDGVITKIDFKESTPSEKEFIKINDYSAILLASKDYVFITDNEKLYIYDKSANLLNTVDALDVSSDTNLAWDSKNYTLYTLGRGDYNNTTLKSYILDSKSGEVISSNQKTAKDNSSVKQNLIYLPHREELILFGRDIYSSKDLSWKKFLSNNMNTFLEDGEYLIGSSYFTGSSNSSIYMLDKNSNIIAENSFEGNILNIKKINESYELLINDNHKLVTKAWKPKTSEPSLIKDIEIEKNLVCDLNCFIKSIDNKNIIQSEDILFGINNKNKEIIRFDLSKNNLIEKIKIGESIESIIYHKENNSLYVIFERGEVNVIDYNKKELELKKFLNTGETINRLKITNNLLMIDSSYKRYIYDLAGNLKHSDVSYTISDIDLNNTAVDSNTDRTYFKLKSERSKLYYGVLNENGQYDTKTEFIDKGSDYRNDVDLSNDGNHILFGDKIYNTNTKEVKKVFDSVYSINIYHWDSEYFILNTGYYVNKYLDIYDSSYTLLKKLQYEEEVVNVFKYENNYYVVTKEETSKKFNLHIESF